MNLTEQLAFDLYSIKALSESDIDMLRLLILDYFAASYAGYIQNRTFNKEVEKVILSSKDLSEAHAFMYDKCVSIRNAAFINAIYAHGAELDDGNKKAMGHIGAHVISAVFALAEKLGSTQNEVLIALAT